MLTFLVLQMSSHATDTSVKSIKAQFTKPEQIFTLQNIWKHINNYMTYKATVNTSVNTLER